MLNSFSEVLEINGDLAFDVILPSFVSVYWCFSNYFLYFSLFFVPILVDLIVEKDNVHLKE